MIGGPAGDSTHYWQQQEEVEEDWSPEFSPGYKMKVLIREPACSCPHPLWLLMLSTDNNLFRCLPSPSSLAPWNFVKAAVSCSSWIPVC